MKSKNIPADIRIKSIQAAQNEIKEIIVGLENTEINLEKKLIKLSNLFWIDKIKIYLKKNEIL